jgi:hypothetical protein
MRRESRAATKSYPPQRSPSMTVVVVRARTTKHWVEEWPTTPTDDPFPPRKPSNRPTFRSLCLLNSAEVDTLLD